jgi:hypothetical protein
MSLNLNVVQIWEGENRAKIVYEQIVEKGVTAWIRGYPGRPAAGRSWTVTFTGGGQVPGTVQNPAVIRQPLTPGSVRVGKKLSGSRNPPQRWKSREDANQNKEPGC